MARAKVEPGTSRSRVEHSAVAPHWLENGDWVQKLYQPEADKEKELGRPKFFLYVGGSAIAYFRRPIFFNGGTPDTKDTNGLGASRLIMTGGLAG